MRKRYLSTKFPHQEIRWNYGILRSVSLKTTNNTNNILSTITPIFSWVICCREAYSEPCQTSNMALLVNSSILDVWQGSEYDSAVDFNHSEKFIITRFLWKICYFLVILFACHVRNTFRVRNTSPTSKRFVENLKPAKRLVILEHLSRLTRTRYLDKIPFK